jgi:cell division protein DivIC
MMLRFKFIEKIPVGLRNKYVLTITLFLLWLLLFDSNNLISRIRELRMLRNLKNDREYYMMHIEEDKRKLHELKTDNDNLEKFAREQYHMKKPDEDIYIVLTPSENRKLTRRNN